MHWVGCNCGAQIYQNGGVIAVGPGLRMIGPWCVLWVPMVPCVLGIRCAVAVDKHRHGTFPFFRLRKAMRPVFSHGRRANDPLANTNLCFVSGVTGHVHCVGLPGDSCCC